MDSTLLTYLIVGFILYFISRKKKRQDIVLDEPNSDSPFDTEVLDNTELPGLPQVNRPMTMTAPAATLQKASKRKPLRSPQPATQGATTAPTAGIQAEGDTSEYTISSAEDARRAIIWSEILQRKY